MEVASLFDNYPRVFPGDIALKVKSRRRISVAVPTTMDSSEKELVEERVAYIVDKENVDQFVPRISVMKTIERSGRPKVEKSFRAFATDDVQRVLDFENVPDPPPDGPMMHGEGGLDNMKFPKRHMCLRGGYLFYFDLNDVSGTGQSHYVRYHGPPMGVVPLDKIRIEFPPGGRRVFREHAQSEARTGYELAILHDSYDEVARPPAFIAADSLALRDKWANAIKARAEIEAPTPLRAQAYGQEDETFATKPAEIAKERESKRKDKNERSENSGKRESRRKGRRSSTAHGKDGKDGDDGLVGDALQEFGKNNFLEKAWVDNYFETHNDIDADQKGRQLEQWQEAIKKGLKNAVLEQYEYFVEASAEMTKMGKEVVELKTLVETQVETIKEMKEIDFSGILIDSKDGNGSQGDGANDRRKGPRRRMSDELGADYDSEVSSVSSYGDGVNGTGPSNAQEPKYRDPESKEGAIVVPEYLEGAAEEITAFAKESRYTDATELWYKTKEEASDIIRQVSPYR